MSRRQHKTKFRQWVAATKPRDPNHVLRNAHVVLRDEYDLLMDRYEQQHDLLIKVAAQSDHAMAELADTMALVRQQQAIIQALEDRDR